MKTLETERLLLRAYREEDADDLYEFARLPDVGPNAGWKPHESREESLTVIRRFIEKDDVWAIVYRESGKVIGSIGLHHDEIRNGTGARMIGYVLSPDYWGRGLVPEAAKRVLRYAFEEENLGLVSVFHYPFNNRSKRVIEKCGFRYEGTLRLASKIYNGEILDNCCYSMTREEYQSDAKNESCS